MFILLGNLAVADICFISSTVPKLLASLATHDGCISLYNCLLQFFMYYSVGVAELCSLALLSIDRIFTPFLNPFIYTLRNKMIKKSLKCFFTSLTCIELCVLNGVTNCIFSVCESLNIVC
ncbi:olfactory receptor 1K1, partial [Pelobates cultripes]